ncbi:MAG: AbrB/MazE/SpoVT family DNA-binding domain-containing protein [Calditrichia bacterium]|nr:AbrB/MazE/SpoVT family DNA-binding domain-containing protein [Calditrichia bacterium]
MVVKLRKVGNSIGLILPKNVIDDLNLKEGDILEIFGEKESIKLVPQNPEFALWAEAYKKANTNYKNALNQLAQ